MFGMGNGKKQKKEEWAFDLEKELKDPQKMKVTKELLNTRIQDLKTLLRKGEEKAAFDEAQNLLQGYMAAQKVIQRIGK